MRWIGCPAGLQTAYAPHLAQNEGQAIASVSAMNKARAKKPHYTRRLPVELDARVKR